MKVQRKNLEVFNMSFLDIISCAFGAIVMLVLLAKNGDQAEHRDVADMASLLASVAENELKNEQLVDELQQSQHSLAQLSQQNQAAAEKLQQLQQQLASTEENMQKLSSTADALAMIKTTSTSAMTSVAKSPKRVEQVGGIPVDSEYVIFIIDTSGSMRVIWQRLIKEMANILDIHPKVKGFQVMNDMGNYLMPPSSGKWMKDTKTKRRAVLNAVKTWPSRSNSSPVEGLEVALKTYAKPGRSLSIYILGDEYNGGSYDPVLDSLNKLNTDSKTGKRIARIHGIGFVSGAGTSRFSTLMREVCKQNRGTFLALPR